MTTLVRPVPRMIAEAQLPCGQHQSPASNDPPLGVDQDQNEPKPIEARGDLQPATGTNRGVKSRERT